MRTRSRSRMSPEPCHLKILEKWMSSYKPEELFDKDGRFVPELKTLAPKGNRRMSANPIANGGLLRKPSTCRISEPPLSQETRQDHGQSRPRSAIFSAKW